MRCCPSDELAEADVDAGRDKDRRGHDAEVLNHEVDDMVRIFTGRQRPKAVPQDLHNAGQGERRKIPGSVSHQLEKVKGEGDCEENNSQDAERKIRSIANIAPISTREPISTEAISLQHIPVNDNPCIMRAMRIRKVGVNKPSAGR